MLEAPNASILRFVRPSFGRIIVATACLVVGLFIGHRHAQQRRAAQLNSTAAVAASPATTAEVPAEDEGFPETVALKPLDIYYFIRDHPAANLSRLWQRLGITTDDSDPGFNPNEGCGGGVNLFEYDLDNDATPETILQIKQWAAYRYLIFKDPNSDSKLIGHFDVYAKYTPSDPVVFLSNGRTWLVVQQTAATGSGLGAWADTVYDVANGRIRPVASYLAHVWQSGDFGFPTKEVFTRPLSCELRDGHVILTVAYRVEYSGSSTHDFPLFTKQQKAVLIGSLKDGSTSLEVSSSEMTARQFETIYNFDSEQRPDFLQYNRAELRAIVRGHNAEKKQWLKEFLEHSRN